MYLGIDLGTSGVKSVLMNDAQQIIASMTAPLNVERPQEGWSEQDPASWIQALSNTLDELKQHHAKELSAVTGIGLSGHMHGATLLDANDDIIRPCMLWNDTRSHREAAQLDTSRSRELTGNILFPGFTAPKTEWVRLNESSAFARVAKVLLPKDYVRYWLTGEHVSEMSDAAGTGWLDVAQRDWSRELLESMHLSIEHMPRLVEGTDVSGELRAELKNRYGMSASVVVAGGAGDNAATACAMGTVKVGQAFVSLGTSGVLFAANDAYRPNPESAVHTFCHALPDTWHQMGVILAATDSLNWLASVTGKGPAELTAALEAKQVTPSATLFLPYLGGERTPHNDAAARGVFLGLSHTTTTTDMAHAVMQGVAFAFKDCQDALHSAGTTISRASAVGGGANSEYWLKLIAETSGYCVDIPNDGDYGASLGAARLGMIAATGADPYAVCVAPAMDKTIEPDGVHKDAFDEQHHRYKSAYHALCSI